VAGRHCLQGRRTGARRSTRSAETRRLTSPVINRSYTRLDRISRRNKLSNSHLIADFSTDARRPSVDIGQHDSFAVDRRLKAQRANLAF
ncbi:hypothetical protein, partial [Paraburkholderia madseniana]|uniref:hypothetical protein n=1 Tax=Paraburkholderia madseniana TaxID=2599607 RepID=UPI001A7E9A40